MQTDMHYYGTYAIARAAGFHPDIARAIATSAEYVDDSDRLDVVCKDGFAIHSEATAHHPTDMKNNTDPQNQRRTWVPFHFMPGLQGDTIEEKLICVTDSESARSVVAHTLDNLGSDFRFSLLGILAHSYIDTFSHYGFSGISSSLNKVDPKSFQFATSDAMRESLSARWDRFAAQYAIGPCANFLVQLGHGSVATYPDQPFLTWEFMYAAPPRPSLLRENQKTFLAGCRKLHAIFVDARTKLNGAYDDLPAFREFAEIEKAVADVLAVEGDDKIRTQAWQRAMQAGQITKAPEGIPDYDSSTFTNDLNRLADYDRELATRTLVYLFLQAADYHRNYILDDLLPRNGVDIQTAPIEWQT